MVAGTPTPKTIYRSADGTWGRFIPDDPVQTQLYDVGGIDVAPDGSC